jgi:hypothetical protein
VVWWNATALSSSSSFLSSFISIFCIADGIICAGTSTRCFYIS